VLDDLPVAARHLGAGAHRGDFAKAGALEHRRPSAGSGAVNRFFSASRA
jgi:hypothetical protein